jgi:hypothetical protein
VGNWSSWLGTRRDIILESGGGIGARGIVLLRCARGLVGEELEDDPREGNKSVLLSTGQIRRRMGIPLSRSASYRDLHKSTRVWHLERETTKDVVGKENPDGRLFPLRGLLNHSQNCLNVTVDHLDRYTDRTKGS